MTDLTDLIARVEKLEGPDRAVDGHLALLDGWAHHFGNSYVEDWEHCGGHWLPPNCWLGGDPFACRCKTDTFFDDPPDYTASLDAALALVERVLLPGWHWEVGTELGIKGASAWVTADDGRATSGERFAPTPALALILALLRALTSQDPTHV